MNFATKTLTILAGCALASNFVGAAPAHAGPLYGDWNYTIDSFADGYAAGVIGANSEFEFYGMALKETADQVYVAINSNLALGGEAVDRTADGYIHYGDLFFNFTGADLKDAQDDLFAIKFDAGNDSEVAEVGLYGNVTSTNVTADNRGFGTLKAHQNQVRYTTYRDNGQKDKGKAALGDLSYEDSYFERGWRKTSTSISSGEYLGGISFLSEAELLDAGLNFGAVDAGVVGRQTIGFSFDRNLLPDGDYIAHVFAECLNDGIAMTGTLPRLPEDHDDADVPEPGLMAGILVVGGLGLMKRRAALA